LNWLGNHRRRLLVGDDAREILDVALVDMDATGQRALVASADLVIAGRYHPAVFAVGAGVPVVCIAYQHKATGVMDAAGASVQVMQVDDVTPEALTALALTVFDDRDAIAERLRSTAPALQARAARTSDLAAALVIGAGDTQAGGTQAGDADSDDA
jgi:polysaccharide pyruvyl transferase WcaK-like protein